MSTSSKETQSKGDPPEEDSVNNGDTNANLDNNVSKGAIPKTKTLDKKKYNDVAKPVKLNNNIEEMSTLNNVPKLNGVTNGICVNYIEASGSSAHVDLMKDDSSSDENDLLSVSDDGCIYTYKGDHVADLPSSFYSLEIPQEIHQELAPVVNNRNDTSSPEMDYLEMDFDPGIDKDADSISDNEIIIVDEPIVNVHCEKKEDFLSLPSTSKIDNLRVFYKAPQVSIDVIRNDVKVLEEDLINMPSTSAQIELPMNVNRVEEIVVNYFIEPKIEERQMPWSCTLSQRTKSLNFRITKRCHCSKGELVSPSENVPPIKGASINKKRDEEAVNSNELEPIMLWNKDVAYLKQITQIGPSACGATAVLNVLHALRFPVPSLERLRECVNTRLRRNDSPLTEYLRSRSVAGTTHEDIIEGLDKISDGKIYARFFHMYPERVVNLYTWLSFWIKNGAVPIATLNLQRCLGTIPDAWHHQMIYGVDADGIHLTNPLECVEAGLLWPQLCSESVLLVRREDVISRWNFRTDLPELMKIKDIRWRRINVVGQVANMIHENGRVLRPGFTNTSHIRIPCAYSSGITLATTVNSPAYILLQDAPELPLLDPFDTNAAYNYTYI